MAVAEGLPITAHLPEWAEGSVTKADHYYLQHQESTLEKFLGKVSTRLGVIIHGDMSQEELDRHLCSFDISKMMSSGPYENKTLSIEAQNLLLASLQISPIYDVHLHNPGYDEGNFLHPKAGAKGVAPWSDYFTFMALRQASGMTAPIGSTKEAQKRLQLYAEHFPQLVGIVLPIHPAYSPGGKPDWEKTGWHLTNQAALETAKTFPKHRSMLVPAASIHPFDPEWKSKMTEAHSHGVRLIKWMPPQGIPPDSDEIDPFYTTMSTLGISLIAHSGPEHTIPIHVLGRDQADWGNPLRFRKPLQLGVNVILAHSGHRDPVPDLDYPGKEPLPGFQLFLRLAKESYLKNETGEWTGKLYGDLAAVLAHYGPDFIKQLLLNSQNDEVRLVYGSDYPFTNLVQPFKDPFVQACKAHLLEHSKVAPLKEIRNWNPLLANYVFARSLAYRCPEGTFTFPKKTFTGEMFESHPLFL